MEDLLTAVRCGDASACGDLVAAAPYDDRPIAIRIACELGNNAVFDAIIDVIVGKCAWALDAGLHAAVRGQHRSLVVKLLAHGAKPKEWRGSPMGDAALLGDLDLMKLLDGPKTDWNPEHVDVWRGWPIGEILARRDGYSPLLNAIRSENADVVLFVLERGGQVNGTSRAGRNPVEFAKMLGLDDIAQVLREQGGVPLDRSGLTFSEAVFFGFVEQATSLMTDIDDTHRGYAFQTAASHGDMRLAHVLGPYATPDHLALGLSSAAQRGDLPALHAMLSLGAKPNAKALIGAARGDSVTALRALLKAGAKIDGRGADRQTALHAALWDARTQAVRFLLDAGADPNAVASDGSTPHSLAQGSSERTLYLPWVEAAGGRAERRKEILKGLKKKLSKDKRKAYFFERAKPTAATAQPSGESPLGHRLGGQPYLDAKHPRPAGLALLMQVDLRVHPDKKGRRDALLQVFEAPSEQPPVVARLVEAPDLTKHKPDNGPGFDRLGRDGYALVFSRAKSDFPSVAAVAAATLDEDEAALVRFINIGGDKLGGWPDWVQDPGWSSSDERLLLQLVGGGITQREYGDAGLIYVLLCGAEVRVVAQSY